MRIFHIAREENNFERVFKKLVSLSWKLFCREESGVRRILSHFVNNFLSRKREIFFNSRKSHREICAFFELKFLKDFDEFNKIKSQLTLSEWKFHSWVWSQSDQTENENGVTKRFVIRKLGTYILIQPYRDIQSYWSFSRSLVALIQKALFSKFIPL
jgi:hypothetical protein